MRGVVLTDALIGTFAPADGEDLRQNRCLLYHVIGGGTGDWDVPVGGMGAVTGVAARRPPPRRARGSRPGRKCSRSTPDGEVRYRRDDTEHVVRGGHVLANVAPADARAAAGRGAAGTRRKARS